MMTGLILNIRPGADAAADAQALQRRGVPSACFPVMDIIALEAEMPDPAGVSGLIFTSRHAVQCFLSSVPVAKWADKPVFAVGRATAAVAEKAGFGAVIHGSGGGAALVPFIQKHEPALKAPLLWPSAAQKSFDMVAALAGVGVSVVDIPVYEAIPTLHFDKDIAELIRKGKILGVISMSSRTSKVFVELLHQHDLWHHRRTISLVAGSAVIAQAAGTGWQNVYVARRPKRSRILAIAALVYRKAMQSDWNVGRVARRADPAGE